MATLRVDSKYIIPEYLQYFLRTSKFQSYLWLNAGFSAQPGVYLGTIQNSSIPKTSLDEQQKIIHHIDTELSRIDLQVNRTQKLIDLLTEYRTALISEVVTGKVKVTD